MWLLESLNFPKSLIPAFQGFECLTVFPCPQALDPSCTQVYISPAVSLCHGAFQSVCQPEIKTIISGVLWWCSRSRTWHCHCCGSSVIPGWELVCATGPDKTKQTPTSPKILVYSPAQPSSFSWSNWSNSLRLSSLRMEGRPTGSTRRIGGPEPRGPATRGKRLCMKKQMKEENRRMTCRIMTYKTEPPG